MAQPIRLTVTPNHAHEEARARLTRAAVEHADALIAACEVLQELHDRGVLDVLRSAIAAGNEILEVVVDNADSPDATRMLRNLLFLANVLGKIEPDWIKALSQSIPEGLAAHAADERADRMHLWSVFQRARSADSVRGLAATIDFLESFGRRLHALEATDPTT